MQEETPHEARVGNNVTVRWYNEHWKACVAWLLSKEDIIGGKGQTAEIDESKCGKRKYNTEWLCMVMHLCMDMHT